ncbi:MAG: diguanylate cyclase [Planctomycetota bacterium]
MRHLKKIPPISSKLIELLGLSLSETPSLDKVATFLKEHPALEKQFFQVVNHPESGRKVKVQNLEEAFAALQWPEITEIAVTLAFIDHVSNHHSKGALEPKTFCSHALASAIITRELGRLMELKNPGLLYWLGLFHEMGKIVLYAFPGSKYEEVIQRARKGIPLLKAERQVFLADSLQVWSFVARKWSFPARLIQAFEGMVAGKVSTKMHRLIGTACRISEMLGCRLFDRIRENAPFENSDVLSLLDGKALYDISQRVQQKMTVYTDLLDLPRPDVDELPRFLYQTARELSRANSLCEKIQRELKLKLYDLEKLAQVFTGIIKSLEGNPLTFSVLESLMEGFQFDGAFMLNCEGPGVYSGYAARSDEEGEAGIDLKHFTEDQLSPSMKECIEGQHALCVEDPRDEEVLVSCLGNVAKAWIVPAFVGRRLTSILGMGLKHVDHPRFDHDFGRILDILATEIGLSVENTLLYNKTCKDAGTDPLTGISNRRNIIQILTSEFARFRRKGTPLSVAIIDVDRFKSINDQWGHLVGDEVLLKISEFLKNGIRDADYIGRYGGDEFMAVFPRTPLEKAFKVMDRLCNQLSECDPSDLNLTCVDRLSLSAGVAGAVESMVRFDDLINTADSALYKAKGQGRNRCLALEPVS